MAADTKYGANYTLAYVNANPKKYGKGDYNGGLHLMVDTFTFAEAATEVGDILKIGKLPKGARVVKAFVKSASQGTTGIWDLGNAASADALETADPDGYVVAADAGGQAVQSDGSGAKMYAKLLGDVDLQLVCTEATQASTGVVMTAGVFYVID